MRVILGEVEEYSIDEYLKYRMAFKNMEVSVDGVTLTNCYGFDTDKGEAYVYVEDKYGHVLTGNLVNGSKVRKAIIRGFINVRETEPADSAVTQIKVTQTFYGDVSKEELDASAKKVADDYIAKILKNHEI